MNTERWERTKQILEEALRHSSEDRNSYLDVACGADQELRDEVESLIASHEAAGSQFLAAAAPEILDLASSGNATTAPLNHVIGNYRLIEELGHGGMGVVWLAEQTEPVKRQVALKLIKGGMFDSSALQRFQSERQSLATMNHPAIAKVFDAGATSDGQPYFVMEYVAGVPITDYCDRKRLPIPERLELFIKVCEGVQHAHQKALIHRDLKPANILVVEVDGKPLPRIIDFGLAKAATGEGLEEAQFTRAGSFLGTPGYMSPEQADPGLQDVDTRTDVYSLGAVLYVLLTGSLPFETGGGAKQRFDEALRQLREDDPPRPSTKAGTQRESSQATAEARGTEPKQLASLLRGDLDWITMKALERDRSRRYATPTELAADIRRYLRNEPVQAHPASVWYRGRKFVGRYWLPVAAASIVIASLSAGLYVANRQRLIAERRFTQLRQLSNQLVDFESQLTAPDAASDLKLHRNLIATSIQYLEALRQQTAQDKVVTLEIASAYLRVARIQGVPEWNQQGHYAEAEESLSKADLLANSVLRADPRNREALWVSANVAHDRAVTAYAERNAERVLAYSPIAVEGFDRLARLGNLTRHEINGATYIYGDLAEVHIGLHRFEDAVRYARLGIEFSRNTTLVPGPRAQAFNMLAGALTYLGDFEGALEASGEARKNLEKLFPPAPKGAAYAQLILYQTRCREGLMLGEDGGVNLDRPLEAVVALRQAYTALKENDANDYQARTVLATAGRYLGDVLRHTNPRGALDVYDQSLRRIREVPDDIAARRLEVLLLAGSSYPARWIHRESDARARVDAALRLLRETKAYPAESIELGSETDAAVRALADDYAETGQPGKAVETYLELQRKIMATNPRPEKDLVNAALISRLYSSLAPLLRRVSRRGEAVKLEDSRLELWRQWDSRLPNNPFVKRQLAGKSVH